MSAGTGLEREGSSKWEAIGFVRHRGEALVASGRVVDAGWRNPIQDDLGCGSMDSMYFVPCVREKMYKN